MNLKLRPVKNKEILYRTEDGKTFLLNETDGKPFYLEEIGSEIWSMINGENSLSDLINNLQTKYEDPDSLIESDIIEFIKDLETNKLIYWEK